MTFLNAGSTIMEYLIYILISTLIFNIVLVVKASDGDYKNSESSISKTTQLREASGISRNDETFPSKYFINEKEPRKNRNPTSLTDSHELRDTDVHHFAKRVRLDVNENHNEHAHYTINKIIPQGRINEGETDEKKNLKEHVKEQIFEEIEDFFRSASKNMRIVIEENFHCQKNIQISCTKYLTNNAVEGRQRTVGSSIKIPVSDSEKVMTITCKYAGEEYGYNDCNQVPCNENNINNSVVRKNIQPTYGTGLQINNKIHNEVFEKEKREQLNKRQLIENEISMKSDTKFSNDSTLSDSLNSIYEQSRSESFVSCMSSVYSSIEREKKDKKKREFIAILQNIIKKKKVHEKFLCPMINNFSSLYDLFIKNGTIPTGRKRTSVFKLKRLFQFYEEIDKKYCVNLKECENPIDIMKTSEFLLLYLTMMQLVFNQHFKRTYPNMSKKIEKKEKVIEELLSYDKPIVKYLSDPDNMNIDLIFVESTYQYQLIESILKHIFFVNSSENLTDVRIFETELQNLCKSFMELHLIFVNMECLIHSTKVVNPEVFIEEYNQMKVQGFPQMVERTLSVLRNVQNLLINIIQIECQNNKGVVEFFLYDFGVLVAKYLLMITLKDMEELVKVVDPVLDFFIFFEKFLKNERQDQFDKLEINEESHDIQSIPAERLLSIVSIFCFFQVLNLFLSKIKDLNKEIIGAIDSFIKEAKLHRIKNTFTFFTRRFLDIRAILEIMIEVTKSLFRYRKNLEYIILINQTGERINSSVHQMKEYIRKVKSDKEINKEELNECKLLLNKIILDYKEVINLNKKIV